MRNLLLASLIALLPMACAGGSGETETESGALLAALLLGAGNESAIVSGDAPVPVPPGAPAPPGAPMNEPILMAPTLHTANFGQFDASVRLSNIQFEKPVHDGTVVMAFIGGLDMTLQPDNTVTKATMFWQRTAANVNGGMTTFNGRGYEFADHRIKIILVSRNEFGVSSREIPVRHARSCQGAVAPTPVIGDCATHCIEMSVVNPTTWRWTAKNKTVDGMTYVWVDLIGWSPLFGNNEFSEFVEVFDPVNDGNPIPADTYEATTEFNHANYKFMCIDVGSDGVTDTPFETRSLRSLISLP